MFQNKISSERFFINSMATWADHLASIIHNIYLHMETLLFTNHYPQIFYTADARLIFSPANCRETRVEK